MQYLVTSRKAVVLDGVLRNPGDLIENPSNSAQLIRRGLAVPFGNTTEQAETFSPSSEPAHSPSSEGDAANEGEVEVSAEAEPSDGEEASVPTADDDDSELAPEPVAIEEEPALPTGSSTAAKKKKA